MKKIIFISLLLYTATSCLRKDSLHYEPKTEDEKAICELFWFNANYYDIKDIVKVRTINNAEYMDSIDIFNRKIEEYKKIINDSSVIALLVPEESEVNYGSENYIFLVKHEYIEYKIETIPKDKGEEKKDFFTLISHENGVTITSPIVDKINDLELIANFNTLKVRYNNVLNKLEGLTHKPKDELALMCKEEKERQKAAEKARIEAEKQAEANKPISSWNDVADIINNTTGKVIGIWRNRTGGMEMTLVIYQKKGTYYMSYCEFSKNPINEDSSMRLRKKSNSTFEYNQEGSDMPERFTINNSGDLEISTFNPDSPYGPEWVDMGTYTKVY